VIVCLPINILHKSVSKIKICTKMKKLNCCDAGFDCAGVIRADSDEAVLTQAAQHALEVHGVTVTAEMAAQIKTLIKNEAEDEA
jgi:predicted small metal-binding protein